jgi:hypothetical protein
MEPNDLGSMARAIVEANLYMTLATADESGRPWASPVWFAHEDYTDFLWVSRPDARHSRNVIGRRELGIVIFDSTVPPSGAQALYVDAVAEELTGDERERMISIYSRRSTAHGSPEWRVADVTAPAPRRLYRATALKHFVLQANDQRLTLEL